MSILCSWPVSAAPKWATTLLVAGLNPHLKACFCKLKHMLNDKHPVAFLSGICISYWSHFSKWWEVLIFMLPSIWLICWCCCVFVYLFQVSTQLTNYCCTKLKIFAFRYLFLFVCNNDFTLYCVLWLKLPSAWYDRLFCGLTQILTQTDANIFLSPHSFWSPSWATQIWREHKE